MASAHAGIVHQPQGQSTIEHLRLEEVSVKAWVVDVSSRIVLIQTFYNPSDEPTGRAKYVFPLPANAAVCAFKLTSEDGSVIIGEVREKEEAALSYARAVEQGKMAALVESVTDDIFTISVGSIPAAKRVTAYLTFVMDLLDEGLQDHIRLQLPIRLAERYGTPPAAILNTSAADSRTRLRISVDIQTSGIIHGIQSPTHRIVRRRYKGHSGRESQRRMSALWKSPEFLESDFVITIHAEGLDKPRCFAEFLDASYGGGKGPTIAMQLTLVPKFLAPKITSQEYIFIIDRSGSMSNAPIETAKRTLSMLLRLLPSSGTTFNIFSFGSHVTSMWGGSRGLDQASLIEATSHVDSMSANYGGTEIPTALHSAFNSRGLDRPAVVFLLTDGQVSTGDQFDPFAVISNAVGNSPPQAPTRLFVLGIGTGVSSDVCSRLARAGNGECLFALAAEDISGKCARLLNAGRSKNIERIDIDWGYDASGPLCPPAMVNLPASVPALAPPPPVQQAPYSLTKIFSGIRFTVFSIASYRIVPTSIKLITKLDGVSEPQELSIDVMKVKPFRDTSKHSITPIVHTLAARRLIMELDGGGGPLPTPAPADALLTSGDELRKAGIVRLGLTYQLASKHTSFVAVQKGDERIRHRLGRGGDTAWIRSRLQQNDTHEESAAEAPTFLDSIFDAVSSILSIFGFRGNPVAPTSTANASSYSHSQRQPKVPGAYDNPDSGMSKDGEDRGRKRFPSPTRSSASRRSADTFSTLSSLEGSSSSCWTSSRSPSPQPRDPIERAPSPQFFQGTGTQDRQPTNGHPGASHGTRPRPGGLSSVSPEVYNLFLEMGFDGSSPASSLLTRLVGDPVLRKADELGIDQKVWATVVVAAYMKEHLQGEPDLLELLLEKAKEFVEMYDRPSGNSTRGFDEMVREAAALLKRSNS